MPPIRCCKNANRGLRERATHNEENADARINDFCKGESLKIGVWAEFSNEVGSWKAETYGASALAKGGRERVEDIHGRA